MSAVSLTDIPQLEIIPGFRARMVHANQSTTAFWEIEEGALLPEHHHVHEQISIVTKGRLELVIQGVPQVFEPGMVAVIPSHVPHSGRALTYVEVTDVFTPVREDYLARYQSLDNSVQEVQSK